MKQILAAFVLTAMAVGSASAGKPSKSPSNHNNSNNGKHITVVVVKGTKFSGGLCYPGRHHCHWTYQCYWPKYKCNCYWDPCTSCYYYWCEVDGCYYPITYIGTAAPLVVVAPIEVVSPPAGVPLPPK